MEHLKSYLITRLLAVMSAVIAVEAVGLMLVQNIILPLAAQFASYQSGRQKLNALDFLFLLGVVIFGVGSQAAIGLIGRSAVLFLLVLSLFLLLMPIAAGLIIYATIVSGKVDQIQKQRDAERDAYEKERNLMLSDFAHDLKTPITTITGYAKALSDGIVEEDRHPEYLEAIYTKSNRMTELITLLFEFVKLGSAGFQLKKEYLDINELVMEIAAARYSDFEEKGMELVVDIPERRFGVSADRMQIYRVVDNLLTNAIRHNPEGTTVGVIARPMAAAEEIYVADTGVPITKDPEQLFEPFVKGDDARSGDKGSGLGLSIAKQITDLHGFRLSLIQPYNNYTKAFALRVFEADEQEENT